MNSQTVGFMQVVGQGPETTTGSTVTTTGFPAQDMQTGFDEYIKNNPGHSNQYVPWPSLPAPCPSCGHCPTCGRGGHQAYPYYQPNIVYCNNAR